jgi:hypothetical protein
MRVAVLFCSLFVCTALLAQKPAPNTSDPATTAAKAGSTPSQSAEPASVDTIIELVKANMSEALVIKTIQKQGQAYDLSPTDLLKLQKAGVSEKIISTLLDPGTSPMPNAEASAAPSTTAPAPAEAGRGVAASKGAPQSAAKKDEKPGGMFSSLKDRLGQSASKSVDGLGNTASDAVDKMDQEVKGTPPKGNSATAAKKATPAAGSAASQAKQSTAPAGVTAPAANATAAASKSAEDQLNQLQSDAQKQQQVQQAADRQKQAQKAAACRQQASKAHPEGGAELVKTYLACIQAP